MDIFDPFDPSIIFHMPSTYASLIRHDNRTRENKSIIVSNINPKTKRKDILKAFQKYGYIYSVELDKDEYGVFKGTATVEFSVMPKKFDINHPIIVNDQLVHMVYGRVISVEHRPTKCFAISLSLGIMLKSNEFVEEWTINTGVKLSVDYRRRMVEVNFKHMGKEYQMESKFGNISNDVVVENVGPTTYLTIPLNEPAKIFEVVGIIDLFKKIKRRVNKIPRDHLDLDLPISSKDPMLISAGNSDIRIGTWLVWRIKFEPAQRQQHWLRKLLAGMADHNLVPRDNHLERLERITVINAHELPTPKDHNYRAARFNFDVLYHLECNISANYLVERTLDDTFYDLLASWNPTIACGILELIAQQKKRVWYPTAAIKNIYKKHPSSIKHKRRMPEHCSVLRKVIITPTTIIVEPMSVETANRVVRYFKSSADRFIRVQFSDEGKMRVAPSFKSDLDSDISTRIYATLKNGIQFGDRKYEYLGFSSSQLREHGCWFYAPFVDHNGQSELSMVDAKAIRSWMGDFKDIKIVAKHAARIGQCFSSTMAIMKLKLNQVEYIDDIVINDYTFSDGVGNISCDLADDVRKRLSLRCIPSAFQFRLGGAKGVLMVSNKLKGRKIQLRPSQVKFNSDHYMLEIVRTSSNISAYLNRQAITLLSTLGVEDNVFMSKFRATIKDLNRMLAHPKEATKILRRYSDSFGIRSFMADIVGAGFLERKDPFIKNLLNVFRLRMLKNLKEKAKIPIQNGAFCLVWLTRRVCSMKVKSFVR
ncbi:RNA dependent RNA polymerase-domain-containing protein [Chlamydoabsidia padenii]|nr:RNA dependent RNA polymerase-domain-containing protein [Chlamydoabsidia padenii]